MAKGTVRRARATVRKALGSREKKQTVFSAVLTAVDGSVYVPGDPNYCYASIEGRSGLRRVLNVNKPAWDGLCVLVGYTNDNPGTLQVVGLDLTSMPNVGNYSFVPDHAKQHILLAKDGGNDVVFVRKQMILPMLVSPTNPPSTLLATQKDFYPWGVGWNYWAGGVTLDFVTAVPVGDTTYLPLPDSGVYALIAIDGATNTLTYTKGTEFPSWPPPAEATSIPAPSTGTVPLAAVYLWAEENRLTNDAGFLTDGFEDPGAGGPDIWASWIETVGAGALANDAVIFHGGANSCQTTEGGGGRDTYVYEDIIVEPGDNYQLRFWTRGDGGANDGAYRVYDNTNGADIIAITATGHVAAAWTEIVVVFAVPTTPLPCTSVRIYFYCPAAGASQAWYDDATCARVPSELTWTDLRDVRLFNAPMAGSVAPAVDGWIALNAANAAVWAPDCVAVLHNSQVVEYANPDAAFNAAVGGDVILVPPGTWTLTQAHVLANYISVWGMGPIEDCVLTSTLAGAIELIGISKGTIQNVYIERTATHAGTLLGLRLFSDSVARDVIARVENNDAGAGSGAYGINSASADVFRCMGLAYVDGRGVSAGVRISAGVMEGSYAYAYTTNAAGNVRGIEALNSPEISWSTGRSAGQAGSTRYGILSSTGVTYLRHCYMSGDTFDIKCTTPGDAVAIYSVEYNTVDDIDQMIWQDGDHPAKDDNATITGMWTYDQQIRFKELAAAPAGPGTPGYTDLFALDVAGQSKFFFKDDTADSWEFASIARDVTLTVRAVGGDFTTLQGAIDFFVGRTIMGTCVIDVEVDTTYDEQINFDGLMIAPGSYLELVGDTRTLAAMSYVDGMLFDRLGFWAPNCGTGTCALANAGNTITVTGTGGNPDFDADGWGAGDRILVKDNANAFAEYTIAGVLNNVITLTVAAPAVGNNGSAIAMVPNRAIELTAAGSCVTVTALGGVRVYGFYLQTAVGASCHGLNAGAGGKVQYRNLLTFADDYGLYASGAGSQISYYSFLPASCWSANVNTLIVIADGAAAIRCTLLSIVGPGSGTTTKGFYTQHMATLWAVYANVSGCDDGYWSTWQSEAFAAQSQARFNDVGYRSEANSMIVCTGTMAVVGPNVTADYMPNPAGAGQFAEDANTFGVLYKS